MRQTRPDAIADLLFDAAAKGRLFDGELLRVSTGPCAGTWPSSSGWHITSVVPAALLEAAHRARPEKVMTSDVLAVSSTLSYWVIGYSTGVRQHRLLLPLVGADVRQLVRELPEKGLTLDFQTEKRQTAYSARVPVSTSVRVALEQAVMDTFDVDRVLQETLLVTSMLLKPGALRPAPSTAAPTTVSVTGVLPAGLMAVSGRATKCTG